MSFREKARNYDTALRDRRSKMIAEKITNITFDTQNSTMMEYGCATGLISFHLYDKFKKLTLIDKEEEMINIVREKVETNNISNIFPLKMDLTKEDYEKEKFDVIFTSLTLHHIINIENIIEKFYHMLHKGGLLIIIDLDKEDGSFHMDTKNFVGHNGFEHEDIENILKRIGFRNLESKTFFHGKKSVQNKNIPYSLFYTFGYKK